MTLFQLRPQSQILIIYPQNNVNRNNDNNVTVQETRQCWCEKRRFELSVNMIKFSNFEA